MGKSTLLCFFLLASGHFFANARPDTCLVSPLDECNAPPPDNFRVTQVSSHSISVAWSPISPGADHYLEVYESDGNDAWNLINIYNSIPDSTKTVDGLTPHTKYQFKIYTKCDDGEPGANSVIINHITLILELTLGGRQPIDPHPVDCHAIPFLAPDNEWVGYRVSKGEEYGNYFEFVSTQESGLNVDELRRLQVANFIVAADEHDRYPKLGQSSVEISMGGYVKMGDIATDILEHIGYVDIVKTMSPNASVDLCPSIDFPWDPAYTFQAFVAPAAVPIIPSFASNTGNRGKTGKKSSIAFSNPFSGNLELNIHQNYEVLKIALWAPDGALKFDLHFDEQDNVIILPTMNLPAGAYLLAVTTDDETTNFRIIKM